MPLQQPATSSAESKASEPVTMHLSAARLDARCLPHLTAFVPGCLGGLRCGERPASTCGQGPAPDLLDARVRAALKPLSVGAIVPHSDWSRTWEMTVQFGHAVRASKLRGSGPCALNRGADADSNAKSFWRPHEPHRARTPSTSSPGSAACQPLSPWFTCATMDSNPNPTTDDSSRSSISTQSVNPTKSTCHYIFLKLGSYL